MQASKRAGRFEVGRILGVGGKGAVYAAYDGDREIALKLLRDELVGSEQEKQRFFREAEAMARVSHPSLVRVLEAGVLPDGRPYLCMPLLVGETLAVRLHRGALDASRGVAIFEALAAAVSAIHDAGLVHRDIKPENVMMVSDAEPVLLDLGLAREVGSALTTTGVVTGTRAYMAPERFFGRSATVASDVYELALVLYLMLTGGVLPWTDESDPQARLSPRPLAEVLPSPSPRVVAMSAAIARALSPRPEARFESVRGLVTAVLREPIEEELAVKGASPSSRVTEDLAVLDPPAPAIAAPLSPSGTTASAPRRGVALGFGLVAAALTLSTIAWVRTRPATDGGTRSVPVTATAAPEPSPPPSAGLPDPPAPPETAAEAKSPPAEARPKAAPSRPRGRPRATQGAASGPAAIPPDDRTVYEHR